MFREWTTAKRLFGVDLGSLFSQEDENNDQETEASWRRRWANVRTYKIGSDVQYALLRRISAQDAVREDIGDKIERLQSEMVALDEEEAELRRRLGSGELDHAEVALIRKRLAEIGSERASLQRQVEICEAAAQLTEQLAALESEAEMLRQLLQRGKLSACERADICERLAEIERQHVELSEARNLLVAAAQGEGSGTSERLGLMDAQLVSLDAEEAALRAKLASGQLSPAEELAIQDRLGAIGQARAQLEGSRDQLTAEHLDKLWYYLESGVFTRSAEILPAIHHCCRMINLARRGSQRLAQRASGSRLMSRVGGVDVVDHQKLLTALERLYAIKQAAERGLPLLERKLNTVITGKPKQLTAEPGIGRPTQNDASKATHCWQRDQWGSQQVWANSLSGQVVNILPTQSKLALRLRSRRTSQARPMNASVVASRAMGTSKSMGSDAPRLRSTTSLRGAMDLTRQRRRQPSKSKQARTEAAGALRPSRQPSLIPARGWYRLEKRGADTRRGECHYPEAAPQGQPILLAMPLERRSSGFRQRAFSQCMLWR
jgi:hypothetical protein